MACASGLQLEGLSTKKPRVTKFTMKPTITAPVLPPTSSIYRINGTNNDEATCILIRTDGLLSIQYRDKLNEDKEADVFLPDDPELHGDCTESDVSSITVRFKGFTLWMEFKKTPGGERWYVNGVDLAYSSSNQIFEHIDRPGLDVSVYVVDRFVLSRHNSVLVCLVCHMVGIDFVGALNVNSCRMQ